MPRMRIGFLLGAVLSLFVLASAADGMLWKYSSEREEVRTRAAVAEREVDQLARENRELERQNAALRALHREHFASGAGTASSAPPCTR